MSNAIFTLTGDDTLTIFGRVFNNFADDTVIDITYPNDLVVIKTGKNQNTIYAKEEQGTNVVMVLRVMRGSADDVFLMGKFNGLKTDQFPNFVLASGTFVKMLGDGQGNITYDTYNLQGGIFTKGIETQNNVNGETVQGVSIYNMKFSIAARSIG